MSAIKYHDKLEGITGPQVVECHELAFNHTVAVSPGIGTVTIEVKVSGFPDFQHIENGEIDRSLPQPVVFQGHLEQIRLTPSDANPLTMVAVGS